MKNIMFESLYNLYNCKNIYGPYIGDDGRQRCVLYFEDGKTSSKSYSRLLMEEKLGRLLLDGEEVDHKDDNNTNDDINNLQILTKLDNIAKHYVNKIMDNIEFYPFECVWCLTHFILDKSTLTNRIKQTKIGLAFCCRKCSVDYSLANDVYVITPRS